MSNVRIGQLVDKTIELYGLGFVLGCIIDSITAMERRNGTLTDSSVFAKVKRSLEEAQETYRTRFNDN